MTVMDMRRNPKKILGAIARNETVTLTHRGTPVARIEPIDRPERRSAADHPAFGMWKNREDKADPRRTREYLADIGFAILPLTENVGHRASIYMEEYALKSGLGIPDALIAATAVENDEALCTGNAKHYRVIRELKLNPFRP